MDIKNLQSMIQTQAMSLMTSPSQTSPDQTLGLNQSFQELLMQKMNEASHMNQSILTQRTPLSPTMPFSHKTGAATSLSDNSSINTYVKEAAQKFGVDERLIHSVIKMESNYNPTARSGAGAQGLMQLMPATARGLGVVNSLDAKQNINGGTKYLSQMLKKYNGNTKLALAAYNAGPGNVDKYQGIPPFKETQNYVSKVINHYHA